MESGGAGIESLEAGNGGFTVAGGKAQGFSVRRKGSESAGRSQRMPDSLRERGRHGGTRRDAGKPCAIVVHSSANARSHDAASARAAGFAASTRPTAWRSATCARDKTMFGPSAAAICRRHGLFVMVAANDGIDWAYLIETGQAAPRLFEPLSWSVHHGPSSQTHTYPAGRWVRARDGGAHAESSDAGGMCRNCLS